MKKNIGFIYYSFYPVTGGASVHGLNLARELNRLGYQLYKLNGNPDPWTTKKPQSPGGLLWILRNCDLIYIRMDYFLNLRNLIGVVSFIAGKKVIVELNSPSDELHLFGRGPRYIQMVDWVYRRILKKADKVIVVSDEIEMYCRDSLKLKQVKVIRNGGEEFNRDLLSPSQDIASRMNNLRDRYRKLVIWAGSVNSMQNMDWITSIAEQIDSDTGLICVLNEDVADGELIEKHEHLHIFRNLDREDVKYLISGSDTGLAFYSDYPWSRWGFYNSSLKIDEYLNNGLLTLTNVEGTAIQKRHPGYRSVQSPREATDIIRSMEIEKRPMGLARTWADVARETSEVVEEVCHF